MEYTTIGLDQYRNFAADHWNRLWNAAMANDDRPPYSLLFRPVTLSGPHEGRFKHSYISIFVYAYRAYTYSGIGSIPIDSYCDGISAAGRCLIICKFSRAEDSWLFGMRLILFRFGLIRRFAPVPPNEGRLRVLRLVSHADYESRLRIPLVRLFF